jgi:thiol:disulfide interchange protein
MSSPEVRSRLASDFVLLKVNTNVLYDKDRGSYDQFRAAYGNIDSQPYVVFLNGEGEFIETLSFHGLKSVEEFAKLLPLVKDAEPGSESSGLAEQIESKGLLWVLLLVFLGGIGASLTPCVYPLIPITISVFGAREASSRLAAFGLSWVYVSGIVATYTALGLVAATVGKGIGEAMSSPWVLVGIALVLGAMGLSSLGAYEIGLPAALQTKLSAKGGKGVVGAFVMGLLAGLIATPCVGPILVTILVFVAQSQNLVLGAGLLATFALGMGMLFVALGTFAGLLAKLPTSGHWMVGVKTAFGVVFVVFALYYLRLAFPVVNAPIHFVYDVAGRLG